MRVIMTGGGTGGHIYPAIAIADRILYRTQHSEILFIGTEKGLEKELIPKHGYPIKFIKIRGINRKNLLRNVSLVREYLKAKKEAGNIIRDFEPDLVLGTGGYVCGPVIKAAADMGIPTFIHEQNATPGLTNKMLESKVDKVFLGFEEASSRFKNPSKHVVCGNPVRDEFFKADREEDRKKLGIAEDDFVILSFGGSQGAGRINKAMMEIVERYSRIEGVRVFFATGRNYHEPVIRELEEKKVSLSENIEILEYIEDMPSYLSAADLVVSRSGALTISEIAVSGTPSILIPSPNVTGNHQMFNAKAIADEGGAIILEEERLSGKILYFEIEELRKNEKRLKEMRKFAKQCAPLDATDIIYYNLNI